MGRGLPAGAELALLRLQGGFDLVARAYGRTFGWTSASLDAPTTTAPTSSREGHPAVRHQPDGRTAGFPSTAQVSTSAIGCTSTTTATAFSWCWRVAGQARCTTSAAAPVDQQGTHRPDRRSDGSRLGRSPRRRPQGPRSAVPVDISKISAELGYAPAPFEQGLADTIAWYRGHEDWWRPPKKGPRRPDEHLAGRRSERATGRDLMEIRPPPVTRRSA